jgi:hypothetical protein
MLWNLFSLSLLTFVQWAKKVGVFIPVMFFSVSEYARARTRSTSKYYTLFGRLLTLGRGILKGEVSLYHWPPVWLVWNQVYDYWKFLFLFAKQSIPNQSNRTIDRKLFGDIINQLPVSVTRLQHGSQMFCDFNLVKNHKFANNSPTTLAIEKISTDLES